MDSPPSRQYRVQERTGLLQEVEVRPGVTASPIRATPAGGAPPSVAPSSSQIALGKVLAPHVPVVDTSKGYYTIPSYEELASKESRDLARIHNFTLGRKGCGKITWEGYTDIRGLELDSLVQIEDNEVSVYCNVHHKPAVGEELNKPSVVELEGVFPNCDPNTSHAERTAYEAKLRTFVQANEGVTHLSYDARHGVWRFRVPHFSRWSLKEMRARAKARRQAEAAAKAGAYEGKGTDGEDDSPRPSKVARVQQLPTADQDDDMDMESDSGSDGGSSAGMPAVSPLDDSSSTHSAQEEREAPRKHLASQLGLEPERVYSLAASLFPAASQRRASIASHVSESSVIESKPAAPPASQASLHAPYLEPVAISTAPMPVVLPGHLRPLTSRISALRTTEDSEPSDSPSFALAKEAGSTSGWPRARPDAAVFMGRSFRVGWGPDGQLVHIGNAIFKPKPAPEAASETPLLLNTAHSSEPAEGADSGRVVTIEKMPVMPFWQSVYSQTPELEAMTRDMLYTRPLQLDLQSCSASVGESGVPTFTPAAGNELVSLVHGHIALAKQATKELTAAACPAHGMQQSANVWALLNALFGLEYDPAVPGGIKDRCEASFDGDKEAQQYHADVFRREALSDWLMTTLKSSTTDPSGDVFQLLAMHSLAEACAAAIEGRNFRLATLLAQAGTDALMREDLQTQLELWEAGGATSVIDEEQLRVYRLLAGGVADVEAESLPWVMGLGLQLWYGAEPNTSIQATVQEFDALQAAGRVATAVPWYVQMQHGPVVAGQPLADAARDTCFQLLRVYCQPQEFALHKALTPIGTTPDPLDVSLSWHLSMVMQEISSLPTMEASRLYQLTMAFASQLEIDGLWHWAVYVVLRLGSHGVISEDDVRRCATEILNRHVPALQETRPGSEFHQRTEFLRTQLQVPSEWICTAVAQRAIYDGEGDGCLSALQAGHMWQELHDAVVTRYITKTVNGQQHHCEGYFAALAEYAKGDAVFAAEYAARGGIIAQLDGIKEGARQLLRETARNGELTRDSRVRALQQQTQHAKKLLAQAQQVATKLGSWPDKEHGQSRSMNERVTVAELSATAVEQVLGLQDACRESLEELEDLTGRPTQREFTSRLALLDEAVIQTWRLPSDCKRNLLQQLCDGLVESHIGEQLY